MSSDYPPLPRPGGDANALFAADSSIPDSHMSLLSLFEESTCVSKTSPTPPRVICPDGDVIIEYVESSSKVSNRWQVSSESLKRNSPYFQALLDPNKFSEGRLLAQHKQRQAQNDTLAIGSETAPEDNPEPLLHDLPTVKISETPFMKLCGPDAIDLFLKILCVDTLDKQRKLDFEMELGGISPSLVERMIEVAESFNSPKIIADTLRRICYVFGKLSIHINKFRTEYLKTNEERIRRLIVIAVSVRDRKQVQILTHTLLVMGSKYWANGLELPDTTPYLRWRYLGNGMEEELYYRRQCIMNTITDLQAYFLRLYGALEDPHDEPKPTTTSIRATVGAAFSTSHHQTRNFQCRAGLGNASQCDLFHLGQMTRFFAMKSKTVFLGSTLLDPDFSIIHDHTIDSDDGAATSAATHPGLPSDITAILRSLKQYPDYQIDASHQGCGCGVRRRLLPVLTCIEKWILDYRGLLGIDLNLWDDPSSRPSIEWANKQNHRGHVVDIRFEKIVSIRFPFDWSVSSHEENARLFFTAKRRNWEA